jgi:glyceraldehyde 3-phosphate dehydrogenase
MAKVAINGMGRIGRAALKIILYTPALELVAIIDLMALDNLVYLLKYTPCKAGMTKELKSPAYFRVLYNGVCLQHLNIDTPPRRIFMR